MDNLNAYQKKCVNEDGHLLITACPGSGKTTVLSYRAERLLNDFPGSTILAVTFTKDAANELKERILKRVPGSESRVFAGTFHSLSLQLLKRSGVRFKLIDEAQSSEFLERVISIHHLNDSIKSNDLKQVFSAMQSACNPEDHEYMRNDMYRLLWDGYKAMKEEVGVIDFSDILSKSLELLQSGLVEPFNATFLLGDESQDMDEVQHEWINIHAKNGTKVTLVGDDDQSVYGFRYASGYGGMIKFLRDLEAKQVVLPINYRCGKKILGHAANLIEKNKKRVDKPIQAGMNYDGEVLPVVSSEFYSKEVLKDMNMGNERDAEFRHLVGFLVEDMRKNPPKDNFVVWNILSRKNINLNKLATSLRSEGIRYHKDDKSLWDTRNAKFLAGILRYLSVRPGKGEWIDLALFIGSYIDNMPYLYRDGEKMSLVNLYRYLVEDPDKLIIDSNLIKSAKALVYAEVKWRESLDKGTIEGMDACISSVGDMLIRNIMDDKKLAVKTRENACQNIVSCVNDLIGRRETELKKRLFMATNPMVNKSNALEYRMESCREACKESGKPMLFVNMMTMHKSKGLEFDNVFIVCADDYGLSSDGDLMKDEALDVDEERRLFYVAMTRARHRLGFSLLEKPSEGIKSTFLSDAKIL
ncbi:MAG: ATP-dependent helicase [Thiotrichales bacterium]|nr:ATP-dependent helicase [Thiotrichales bacterium]